MNRKLIVVLGLLIAVIGVVGIWMPQIREWQQNRAYRKERQRVEEGFAFEDMWLKRKTTFFNVQRTSEETDKWYKQAKKEFCPDLGRQEFARNGAQILEINILGDAPKPEDASCGDISSSNTP
jgi:hypothetical protein